MKAIHALALCALLAGCDSLPGNISASSSSPASPSNSDCAPPAAAPAASGDPLRLSTDDSLARIDSCYGSGNFGQWVQDDYQLPGFRYDLDEENDPRGGQPELQGRTVAQHQLGNDRAKAFAYNHGYTQFWSQDRNYEWSNYYDADKQHYAGGYGWLKAGDRVISTLYDDKPADAQMRRYFGTGYYAKDTQAPGVSIGEKVYAPWGDDPILLHEVTITNTSGTAQDYSWFEYWDVNPRVFSIANLNITPPSPGTPIGFIQGYGRFSAQTFLGTPGIAAAQWDAGKSLLSVKQLPYLTDLNPMSMYAAALDAPVDGYETSLTDFFGAGGRAKPDEVAADHLGQTLASAALPYVGNGGKTLMALRSPVSLAPGQSITLRYAYGMAHAEAIPALLDKYKAQPKSFDAMRAAWREALPRADFGPGREWMNRELMWTAYTMRSGFTFEEWNGYHNLSQSGYYQYAEGLNAGFRSWMHYVLPMMYLTPAMTREIFRYSISTQPGVDLDYQMPYALIGNGLRFDLGYADDLDFWLLNAAPEYVFATRDLALMNESIPYYYKQNSATMWDHIKTAFDHQEQYRALGPHGSYLTLPVGDWSDLSSIYLQMTESNMVLAQTAYAYPKLAQLAELMGDETFALKVRANADQVMTKLKSEWVEDRGWYSRGYSGTRQLGSGAMFMEPQPWALLAGAATPDQAQRVVDNYQRFLLGRNAPAVINGPTKIGASQSPASNDPDVTERSTPAGGIGDNNAVFVGGAWYDLNGDMTWALGEMDGVVSDAKALAFDEYQRNALATHATVFPDHWMGTITSDDVCNSFYASVPSNCGINSSLNFNGWNMEQPTWFTMNALNLAGIKPTPTGYRIAPHYPFDTWSMRYEAIGIASEPGRLRGYLKPEADGAIQMQVRLPQGKSAAQVHVDGQAASGEIKDGYIDFTLQGRKQQAVDWAVSW